MAFTTLPSSIAPTAPQPTVGWARSAGALVRHHRRIALVALEVAVALLAVALLGSKIPALVSSVGDNLSRLRHPSPVGLTLALTAESVALMAAAIIPRLLLRRHGVHLGRRDALAIGIAANGLAVVVPGGAVPSSVWLARQLNRRGASATLAAWSVLASGFAAAMTLVLLLLIGAGVAGVISGLAAAALVGVVVVGSAVFLGAVHRVDRLAAWSAARDGHDLFSRLVARFVALAADAARWRAGWRTGTEVLVASTANWVFDAGCLVAVFTLVRAPVPWQSILVAYAAGQLLGALVPLPGGLGAVEGGLVGTLVALGSPAGPVVVAVAIYRLVGYWLPAAAALPAYGWARRNVVASGGASEAAGVAQVAALSGADPVVLDDLGAVTDPAVLDDLGAVTDPAVLDDLAVTADSAVVEQARQAMTDGLAAQVLDRAVGRVIEDSRAVSSAVSRAVGSAAGAEEAATEAIEDRVPLHWMLADLEMWGSPGGLCAVSGVASAPPGGDCSG